MAKDLTPVAEEQSLRPPGSERVCVCVCLCASLAAVSPHAPVCSLATPPGPVVIFSGHPLLPTDLSFIRSPPAAVASAAAAAATTYVCYYNY